MKKEKPLWMLRSEHDGWGLLCFGSTKKEVESKALNAMGVWSGFRGGLTMARLKRNGYSVVKVKIVEVTK